MSSTDTTNTNWQNVMQAKIDRLQSLNAELVDILKDARSMLEDYEEDSSGEMFNWPDLNALLAKAEQS